jgi:hypothetical protein
VQGKDLKKYRHSVAVLKRAGLLAPTTDARSVKPTPQLTRTINRYKDVVSGQASVISPDRLKLSPSEIKGSGGRIAKPKPPLKPKVIVSKLPSETIKTREGKIVRRSPNGVERLSIPIAYKNLEDYLTKLADIAPELTADKGRQGWFSFRYFGNNSRPYRTFSLLLESLMKYNTVESSIDDDDYEEQRDIYERLEFVTIPETGRPAWRTEQTNRVNERRARKKAERDRAYRARLDAESRARYKRQAVERSKKSKARKK